METFEEGRSKVQTTWGLEWWNEWRGDYLFRHALIKHPFTDEDPLHMKTTLNAKFLQECIHDGVHRIIVHLGMNDQWGQRTIFPPDKKVLKEMDRTGQYREEPSKHPGGEPMRFYKIIL